MRGSVRQFAITLLTAAYAILSTCGSAWHLANCGDVCCVTPDRSSANGHADCSASHGDAGRHSGCGHHPKAPRSSGERGSESHDKQQCEICQLFAQSLTRISLVCVEASPDVVEASVCELPMSAPKLQAITATSRGPPLA